MEKIQIRHQSFILHPSGVIFWEERNMLLIADLHLGKVSHFRKHGSAVPQNAIQKNFQQLDHVINVFNPSHICFLGDLFHSYLNNEWDVFEAWISQRSTIEFVLVVGNHDIISPSKYEKIGVKVASEILIDTFLLSHHPEECDVHYNFCGHIHPGVLLGGLGKQRLRLPCFYQTEHQLILPAFGEFTGTHILEPIEKVNIYAITQKEVILVHS